MMRARLSFFARLERPLLTAQRAPMVVGTLAVCGSRMIPSMLGMS